MLEKEEQTKNQKQKRKKEIIQIKVEINEIENRKKSTKPKVGSFFKKSTKLTKFS